MATEEHKQLSSFIKELHKKLRNESKIIGADQAWIQHCQNIDTLKKYAKAMHELATVHWKKNTDDRNKDASSRIDWIIHQCEQYFIQDGLMYQRNREKIIIEKLEFHSHEEHTVDDEKPNWNKIRLLDVGSCYNPFGSYEMFDVLPIDIAPANSDVFKCDFLNINILHDCDSIKNQQTIITLQSNSFHAIVFSLLLEYLPSSKQRLQCCENAFNLLKPEGILIIITPDSKHVGANARIMKSWRYVLAKVGFMRIKYEKLPYIHCMVFRKCICTDVSKRWVKMHENDDLSNEINIPQDFNEDNNLDT